MLPDDKCLFTQSSRTQSTQWDRGWDCLSVESLNQVCARLLINLWLSPAERVHSSNVWPVAGLPYNLRGGIASVMFQLPVVKHNYAWAGCMPAGGCMFRQPAAFCWLQGAAASITCLHVFSASHAR